MDEKIILAELAPAINALRTLSLVALDLEDPHPMALPELPEADKAATYERQMTAIAVQVSPRHRNLLEASARDYRCGFPDRAGIYLQELMTHFTQDAEYTAAFSPAAQNRFKMFMRSLNDV
jgi:hypothetical protein